MRAFRTGINWTVNGTLDGDANAKVTSTLQMMGEMVDYNPGDWEPGKKAMTKVEIALTALTLTIGSTTVYDIDLIAGKMKIAGVERWRRSIRPSPRGAPATPRWRGFKFQPALKEF